MTVLNHEPDFFGFDLPEPPWALTCTTGSELLEAEARCPLFMLNMIVQLLVQKVFNLSFPVSGVLSVLKM